MLRISSAGVLRSYRTGLMRSRASLESARQTAMDFNSFRSFAENPAAATKTFQLVRSYGRNDMYLRNSQMVAERLDEVWNSASKISDLADAICKEDMLSAINGDKMDQETRDTMVATIRGKMQSMVQSLNAKYGESFVYGGQGSNEVPFTMDKDFNLYYRGVNVDTGLGADGQPVLDANGNQITLDALSRETSYVDIGLGLKNNNGGQGDLTSSTDVNSASAMDVSLPGINLVGFGRDEQGNPKNAISQLRDFCNELQKPDFDREKLREMITGFEKTCNNMRTAIADIDTRAGFVNTNISRLKTTSDSLNTQIVAISKVEPALAYSEFSYAQFYYNSALKVGNSILDQSFIDYMR